MTDPQLVEEEEEEEDLTLGVVSVAAAREVNTPSVCTAGGIVCQLDSRERDGKFPTDIFSFHLFSYLSNIAP